MTEGGGLLNDVICTWKDVGFELWDYNGNQPTKDPFLKVTLVDEDGEEVSQYWKAGDAKNWVPSTDGKTLVKTGSSTGVNRGTNMGALMQSIVDSGWPEEEMGSGDDVSIFEGMVAHMIRVPAPKRSGLAPRAPRADGKTFEDTILTVDEIITRPGEKTAPAKKGRAAKAAPAATAGTAPAEGELVKLASDSVVNILKDKLGTNPAGLPKGDFPGLLFSELRGNDLRNDVVTLINDDEDFLSGSELWDYVDGVVSLK